MAKKKKNRRTLRKDPEPQDEAPAEEETPEVESAETEADAEAVTETPTETVVAEAPPVEETPVEEAAPEEAPAPAPVEGQPAGAPDPANVMAYYKTSAAHVYKLKTPIMDPNTGRPIKKIIIPL